MAEAPPLPLGTAAEFSTTRFGGPTRLRFTTPTIGTTVTRLLGNNPKRVFWQAINRSINQGALGWDNALTVANGVPLAPNAGFASMDVQDDGEAVAYEVIAINDVASGLWNLIEVERV